MIFTYLHEHLQFLHSKMHINTEMIVHRKGASSQMQDLTDVHSCQNIFVKIEVSLV